jgi:FKBP-type peptidyl-prolyl cis-trans isomerase FkpA
VVALVAVTAACDDAGARCATAPFTTSSGLVIEDLDCGRGDAAAPGDVVSVRYTGRLADAAPFDSSDGDLFTFPLGAGQVIAGWEEGLRGMREGGRRRLRIPPELAFGDGGVPGRVPPGAVVVYEVELVEAG